ncbi:MAG: hypothetical protein WCG81_17920 [Candidatus Angelobacter sp.]
MPQNEDPVRDITVSDTRRFVRELLELSGRDDLHSVVDEEQLNVPVFQAIVDLALVGGGRLSTTGLPPTDDPSKLGVLIGGQYHLNVKETIWQSLIIAVPLLVSLFQSGDLATTAGSIVNLFGVVRKNLQKLEPEAAQLYLVVRALQRRKSRSQAEDVVHFLNAKSSAQKKWKLGEVKKLLGRMVSADVLTEGPDGLRSVT